MLLVDKPLDWTSFDVIKKIRIMFEIKKVGHAGTLDPKASGLLIVCTGKKTKEISQFENLAKEYTGTFVLGQRTPSYDTETAVSEYSDYSAINEQTVKQVVKDFIGKQLQEPPMYSAAKYGGKPLYRYAREGQTVARQAKQIEIFSFEILACRLPEIDFSLTCSKGTYVRSLVHDIGEQIGCGAMLSSLRRTKIGTHNVIDAYTIDDLIAFRNTSPVYVSNSYACVAAV